MRSLKARFKRISQKNPYWSDYICFAESVDGQKFSQSTISYWFKQLVDKEEYDPKNRNNLIRQLFALSNTEEK